MLVSWANHLTDTCTLLGAVCHSALLLPFLKLCLLQTCLRGLLFRELLVSRLVYDSNSTLILLSWGRVNLPRNQWVYYVLIKVLHFKTDLESSKAERSNYLESFAAEKKNIQLKSADLDELNLKNRISCTMQPSLKQVLTVKP